MAEAPAGRPDEPFALSDIGDAARRPPAERGSLDVRSRALAHLAEHAASEVSGTVRAGGGVRRTLGRSFPHASARIEGGRASIDLDVAVEWPAAVADVVARARDHVLTRSVNLSGVDVRRVDVTVHVVTAVDEPTRASRVQ